MSVKRVPGEGKYAQFEREKRWRLTNVPPGSTFHCEITDHYLSGTSLRLRHVSSDGDSTWKLTQKIRVEPDSPEVVKVTTMYLNVDEYRILATLSANTIRKTRLHLVLEDMTFAVDVFDGRHVGLVLAEVEFDPRHGDVPRPSPTAEDVTHDERYCGAALAVANERELGLLLSKHR